MNCLVVGATGATGRLLVRDLLDRGASVTAIVRSRARLDEAVGDDSGLIAVEAGLSDLSSGDLETLVAGCDAAASCLGHRVTLEGMYGPPRRLVTDATRRICEAFRVNGRARATGNGPPPTAKFVLMNTAGNSNRGLGERTSWRHDAAVRLLRLLVPPHADNEDAAEYLRAGIGPNDATVAWVAVRPDTLIDADAVSPYSLHASPTRSAIFDAGRTSRINVARFMADLVTDDDVWARWRGRMPVIYDEPASD